MPGVLERRESELAAPECAVPELPAPEWAVPERLVDDPLCEEDGAFVPEEGALAGPLPPLPALDAAGAGEPAAGCAAAEPGTGDAGLGETGSVMEENVSTESAAMGDRPA